jgi:glucose-1-phosphate thymidylyltransferase
MRGILLARENGSHLFPLTRAMEYFLLPVGNYPMIFYPLERLKKTGVKQVLIMAGQEALGPIIGVLGSGADYGIEFQYRVQEKTAGSPARTLTDLELAADFTQGEPILVVLGNQIFRDDLSDAVRVFQNQPSGATIFVKEVSNPRKCEIGSTTEQMLQIPSNHFSGASNQYITGVYIFDAQVFDFIRQLRTLSGKGPEIWQVLDCYQAKGQLKFQELQDWWVEVEAFETLYLANKYAQGVELEM